MAAAGYFLHQPALRWMGRALVTDDGPGNGELIVLLAGDYKGDRLRHAVELVRRGYAPKILVDGPPGFYGFRESDLAMRYAETQGWPAGWLDNFPIDADSTREEARLVASELRRRGVGARTFWKPAHLQPPYRDAPRAHLPITESAWDRVVTLPCSTQLSEVDQAFVIATVRELLQIGRRAITPESGSPFKWEPKGLR